MDVRCCMLLMIVLVHTVCVTLVHSAPQPDDFNQIVDEPEFDHKSVTITALEKRLKEDIAREIQDVMELERQLQGNLYKLQAKKRQLEIKKRTPVQCLVNIVSCWRRR